MKNFDVLINLYMDDELSGHPCCVGTTKDYCTYTNSKRITYISNQSIITDYVSIPYLPRAYYTVKPPTSATS